MAFALVWWVQQKQQQLPGGGWNVCENPFPWCLGNGCAAFPCVTSLYHTPPPPAARRRGPLFDTLLAKCADKVCAAHLGAQSPDFLAREGPAVRKLVAKYVEHYQQR